MAKAAGFEIKDILLVGGIAVGGYFIYKMFTQPVAAGSVAAGLGGITEGIGEISKGAGAVAAGAGVAATGLGAGISSAGSALGGAIAGVATGGSQAIQSAESSLSAIAGIPGKIITGAENIIGGVISGAKSLLSGLIPSGVAVSTQTVYPQVAPTNAPLMYSMLTSNIAANIIGTTALKTSTAAPATKSLNVSKPLGATISESKGTAGGMVVVTTAGGKTSTYQTNVGSGTGSSSSALSAGTTNIKPQITAAQKSGQAINLTSLGKGARINLDTGSVTYAK